MKSEFENWYSNSKDKSTSSAFAAGWMCQQSKIDELQKENSALVHVIKSRDIQLENEKHEYDELMNKLVDSGMENKELQKRLDAVKGLAQTLWEKSEEKHQQGKVWESKTLGECADEILDVLEQALKGGSDESN